MRTIWKIWAAILFSVWAYIRVCHYLEKEVPYFKEYDLPLESIKYSFFALSLVALYLSYHFRKTMLKRPSIKSDLKIIERARKLGKPAVLVKYSTIVLVSFAFSESICLFGVVYFFLSGDYETLYVLTGIAAIAMVYHRPRAKELAYVSIVSEGTAPLPNGLDSGDSL
jgi:hypothetical protein